MKTKERLYRYIFKEKKLVIIGILLCLLFVLSQISQPFLLGKALDAVKEENKQLFVILLSICLGLTIFGGIFNYFFEVITGKISQNVIYNIRNDIYLKMNDIPISEFDNRQHGDLLQLEIRDIENVANGIFAVFKTLLQGILTIIITI